MAGSPRRKLARAEPVPSLDPPDDQQLVRLGKSKGFQKLIKEVKRNPVVEATVTGLFKRFGTAQQPDNRLALESVGEVVVIPQPRVRDQKR